MIINLMKPVIRKQNRGEDPMANTRHAWLDWTAFNYLHSQSIRKNMQGTVSLIHPVTREMVYARTIELASLAGRDSREIKQFDYEQAKRELTGESDFDKQQAIFDFNEYC